MTQRHPVPRFRSATITPQRGHDEGSANRQWIGADSPMPARPASDPALRRLLPEVIADGPLGHQVRDVLAEGTPVLGTVCGNEGANQSAASAAG
jgi:hypothetical protein